MGQKIHPTGFRLAVTRNWASRWYAGNGNFAAMLNEDLKARAFLKKKLKNVECCVNFLATDHIGYKAALLVRQAHAFEDSFSFHYFFAFLSAA